VSQFSTNIELLLQQKGSKLRGAVSTGNHVGSAASPVDQIGSVEAQLVTSRFAPMTRVDAPMDRRWVYPSDYDLPQLIDEFDKLRLLTDPKSSYVTNATYALGRKIDVAIINATTGAAKTGQNGGTTTNVLAGNEVDVAVGGANSKLNVQKLKAVVEIAMTNEIDLDEDPLFIAVPAVDYAALWNEIQVISSDFNEGEKPVLKDGKIMSFMGINFIHVQMIETEAAGTNEVNLPVWAKSGMYLGMWNDITTSISVRNDLQSEPWQAYAKGTFGATRLDEKKVFNIESYRA
jgi:hypothetical protein